MPKRSRSHELEELSVARFNDLLPAKWVSHAKLPDYGIDREVEIFDSDGNSTGLTFLVQLRATDNAELADRVVLETDELAYYGQLDLPVIVARYCSATNGFFWQWDTVIRSRVKLGDGQASVTYRFAEAESWDAETPQAIQRTLEVRRALGRYPQSAAVPVRLDLSALPANAQYPVERALGRAITQCAGALTRPREVRLVEVEILPKRDFLAVRIDAVTSVTFDLPDADPETIATSALYALTRLFSRKGLVRQAEVIAHAILARGTPHHSEDLALSACHALAGDPEAMVELAILNGFHRQTVGYPTILFELARSSRDDATRDRAADRFFTAAIEAAADGGAASMAAIHYSIGNHYRRPGCDLKALRHYNIARRMRPAYLQTDYFLRELGGILYEAGHPRCAVEAYRAAQAANDDPFTAFLLGDALLRSGKIGEAAIQFEGAIARHPPGDLVQEAELKRLACIWLRDETGADDVPVRRRQAYAAMNPQGIDTLDRLLGIVREIDGLNPLAHFNLGILRSRTHASPEAIPHFLTCAFMQPGDIEAWANAAICAFNSGQSELLTAILTVAVRQAGADAYDRLRADLGAQGASDETLAALDTVAVALIGEAQSSDAGAFTMRMLDGDAFEALTILDP